MADWKLESAFRSFGPESKPTDPRKRRRDDWVYVFLLLLPAYPCYRPFRRYLKGTAFFDHRCFVGPFYFCHTNFTSLLSTVFLLTRITSAW
jgi:hypothetical protein